MDFDAPLNELWHGYVSPDWRPCPSDDCDNGSTVAAAWVEKIVWQLLILASADEANGQALHPWLKSVPLRPEKLPKPEAIRELTGGLSREYRAPFGHDACDRWSAMKAVVRAAGLDPDAWCTCQTCKGHAMHPADIVPSEAWECTEPPEGDGWQMWETTTEGSPQTPVFATAGELAEHCAEHCTVFADMRWTAEQWLASFDAGTTDTDSLLVMRGPVVISPEVTAT